ncbi:hypothetical protein LR48_Vigan10g003500 [Vigna angularis]|uniref:Uncharacterized protein n=2 Tax=Phaseolus angularis TaxID=3914 RepID=A0A0L9VGN7_PHAAN|nr:uncharacterized protein LOC108345819 [Vigna angularis]KOM54143.1 hypothetical protein LR48_Vigan10g003500 [Vigna angularis]BAU02978.1 hypothetical protein VIGAN_11257700 [Vigna angularis var. angularis]
MEATDLVPLAGENYALKLKHSMQELLSEISKKSPNLSPLVSTFYELMQAKVDPPFEVIWAYAAINFRGRNPEKGDALDKILVAKYLLQLLSACSASVCAAKSIVLLAPVVFVLHGVIVELLGRELRCKREKKAMKEVKSLVDVVLGYISLSCHNKVYEGESDSVRLIFPFTDLARLWVAMNDDAFESLLPLVSSDVCNWICSRGFHVDYLGGAIIMEVFLLKLCLSLHLGTSKEGLEMKLKSWAVSSISSFQNTYFFEILMRTALETPLPLISILKPEDEILSRKVIFDAVLFVDYPFLYSNANVQNLTLTKLIVTHGAVEYFRGLGDQNRTISYIKAFSASRLPLQIIKWVSNQNGLEEKASRANESSPKALTLWLLSLENQGIRVFEDDILKNHATSGLDVSKPEDPASNLERKIADDDLFYVDNAGGEGDTGENDEQNKLISDAFVAAAQTMKLPKHKARKRKGKHNEKKIKFVKYNLHQNSKPVKARISTADDSSSGESEVEDPISDTDA